MADGRDGERCMTRHTDETKLSISVRDAGRKTKSSGHHDQKEIVLRGYDSEAAGGAIREAVRGLEVGGQLPCPHSQLFLQAFPQQGLSSVHNIIEANI
ncbi:hypothetical protein PAMP_010953 [Pampus punctatissimus]